MITIGCNHYSQQRNHNIRSLTISTWLLEYVVEKSFLEFRDFTLVPLHAQLCETFLLFLHFLCANAPFVLLAVLLLEAI